MGLIDGVFGKKALEEQRALTAQLEARLAQAEQRAAEYWQQKREAKDALAVEREAAAKDADSLRKRVAELETARSDEQERWRAERDDAERHLAALEQQALDLHRRLAQSESIMADIRSQRDELHDQRDRIAAQRSTEALQLQSIRRHLDAAARRLAYRALAAGVKALLLKRLTTRADDLLVSLEAQEAEWRDFIRPKLQKLEAYKELESLREELDSRGARLGEDERRLLKEAERLKQMGVTDRTFRDRLQALAGDATKLKELQRDLEARESKLSQASQQLAHARENLAARERDLADVRMRASRIDAQQAELARREAALQKAKLELRHTTLANQEQARAVEEKERRLEREAGRLQLVTDKNASLDGENERLRNLRAADQKAVADLEREMRRVHAAREQSESNVLALKEQLAKLRAKLGDWETWGHQDVIAYLLEHAATKPEFRADDLLCCMGSGPWSERVFIDLMQGDGHDVYEAPHPTIGRLVVGRRGVNLDLLDQQIDERSLQGLRIYSQEMWLIVLLTGIDPFEFESPELMQVFRDTHPVLRDLAAGDRSWPELCLPEEPADEEDDDGDPPPTDNFGVKESPLHLLGYRVGKSSGLSPKERRDILRQCYQQRVLAFSDDSPAAYRESWGRPCSAKRLYRMAWHIKVLIEGRTGSDPRKPVARADWIADFKWLKATLFREHRPRYQWPSI
jgi:hypothetical protein